MGLPGVYEGRTDVGLLFEGFPFKHLRKLTWSEVRLILFTDCEYDDAFTSPLILVFTPILGTTLIVSLCKSGLKSFMFRLLSSPLLWSSLLDFFSIGVFWRKFYDSRLLLVLESLRRWLRDMTEAEFLWLLAPVWRPLPPRDYWLCLVAEDSLSWFFACSDFKPLSDVWSFDSFLSAID